jgi:hypothetical protein
MTQRAAGEPAGFTGEPLESAPPIEPQVAPTINAAPTSSGDEFAIDRTLFEQSPYGDPQDKLDPQEVLRHATADQRERLSTLARLEASAERGVDPVKGQKLSSRGLKKLQEQASRLRNEAESARAQVEESFGRGAADAFHARASDGLPTAFQYDPRKGEHGAVNVAEIAAGARQLMSKNTLLDLANVPRTLKASMDFSAPLRQGAIQTLTEPRAAVSAMRDMFRAAVRGQAYEHIVHDIATHPDARLARESGLYFATREAAQPLARRVPRPLSQREEAFMSRIAGELPGVKQSERAYTVYLDKLRMETFSKYADELRAAGATDPKEFKDVAHWLNLATGRGDIGDWGKDGGAILNAAFFAPRYTASRFQVVNPATYFKMSPAARSIAMRKMVQYGATVGSTLLLAKLAGAEVNLTDPSSADWLKLKIGNTRYDLAAGMQQNMRFLYRMGRALKNTATGQETEPMNRAGKVLFGFVRTKLAPVPGAVMNVAEGSDVVGQPTTMRGEMWNLVKPLMVDDLWNAYQQEGLTGALKTTPSAFGVGVQTYKSQRQTQTAAERMMSGFIMDNMPQHDRTPEQEAKGSLIRSFKQDVRSGKNVDDQIDKAIESGKLNQRDVKAINRAATETPLQSSFKKLQLVDALKVYGAMNENERNQVGDILEVKKGKAKQ